MIEGWLTRDAIRCCNPCGGGIFQIIAARGTATIEIDDSRTFQRSKASVFADGGSAYLLSGLQRQNARLLHELFGLTDDSVGLSCLRLSIGALISPKGFQLLGLRRGTVNLTSRASIFPPVTGGRSRAAGDIADQSGCEDHRFAVVGTAVDEEQRQLRAGSLKPESYSRMHDTSRNTGNDARACIHVSAVTPQNEPHNPKNEPSMVMTATEQATSSRDTLDRNCAAAPRNRNTLLGHNCDEPIILSRCWGRRGARYVGGVAWHLYNGSRRRCRKCGRSIQSKSVLHRTMGFGT